ncbi:MAG: hypothetical protein AABX86_02065 [Nanoarchaeota archaeon]
MATNLLGSWSFVISLVIAIVIGMMGPAGAGTIWILAFLGLIVGLLNVTGQESRMFLLASIAFLVSASSLALVLPLDAVRNMLQNIVTFVGPGAAVVAIKALFEISRGK